MKLVPQIQKLQKRLHKKMREMYSSGTCAHEHVAAEVGHNYSAARWFYEHYRELYDFPQVQPGSVGISKKGKRTCELRENLEEAYAYYIEAGSLRMVGEKYGGISWESVRQIFKRNRLKIMPVGGRKTKRLSANHKGRGRLTNENKSHP